MGNIWETLDDESDENQWTSTKSQVGTPTATKTVRVFVGLCSAVVLRHADIVLSEVNAEAASRFLLSQA
jgi:hypothetical protein